MEKHKFPYNWTLKDAVFTKDKGKVFSLFAGGGRFVNWIWEQWLSKIGFGYGNK